jgi:NTP pyrophosphatase (non-canonical NTP hydrolase)
MVYKLKVHHRKGRWSGKTVEEYLPLLDGEVAELKEAVNDGNLIEILTEAADCGNMALIVAAIAIERGTNGLRQDYQGDPQGRTDMGEPGQISGGVEAGPGDRSEFAPAVVPNRPVRRRDFRDD